MSEPVKPRSLKFFEAVREATDLCLAKDASVYVMGLGVPDPKGIFGTTLGLQEKYGKNRVFDMPCSENAMTGIVLGSALTGMRPILTHQRIDFCLLSVEQIVNQAAKWHYMFGGKAKAPLVIRLMIGKGWGQGPQHSQNLQSWFAHIPGLKVVMPATPYDAKGLLISSIEEDNPVIFIEHRSLYAVSGPVPEGIYRVPLGGPGRVLREGRDLTLVCLSYMTLEAMQAAKALEEESISVEVLNLHTLNPLDDSLVLKSVQKAGRLIVADTGWANCGFAAEIISRTAEKALGHLKCPPRRVTLPHSPCPTSSALADAFYPAAVDIMRVAREMMGISQNGARSRSKTVHTDASDWRFVGYF